MDEFLKKLRELLGLSADASTDDILERVGAMTADAGSDANGGSDAGDANGDADAHRAGTFDPARYVAVAEFQQALTELNALKTERARENAEHAVDEAIRSGKLVPAHREWAIAYCAADPQRLRRVRRAPAGGAAGRADAGRRSRARRPRAAVGRFARDARMMLTGPRSRSARCSASRPTTSEAQERRRGFPAPQQRRPALGSSA